METFVCCLDWTQNVLLLFYLNSRGAGWECKIMFNTCTFGTIHSTIQISDQKFPLLGVRHAGMAAAEQATKVVLLHTENSLCICTHMLQGQGTFQTFAYRNVGLSQ